MKNKLLKNQKGITIFSLLLIIVIMAILASIAIKNIDTGKDISDYNKMCADIELLTNKVQAYYREHNTLPTTGSGITRSELGWNNSYFPFRDGQYYYLLDYSKLYNVTLNFGGGNLSNRDVYVINEQSHAIYYLKGVKINGTWKITK